MPRTDAGALVQIVLTLALGLPLFLYVRRRSSSDVAWFVGGTIVLLVGLFAYRTVH